MTEILKKYKRPSRVGKVIYGCVKDKIYKKFVKYRNLKKLTNNEVLEKLIKNIM